MTGVPRYAGRSRPPRAAAAAGGRQRFERWAAEGRIGRVDFTHLIFVLWGSTQAYADLGPQFALFMDKPVLDDGTSRAPRR